MPLPQIGIQGIADMSQFEAGVAQYDRRLTSMEASTGRFTGQMTTSFIRFGQGVAATLAGVGLTRLSSDLALTASRTQTLGIVMNIAGKNIGFTATELAIQEEALKKTGITTQEARTNIARMIQAQLDVTQATKLARVAQDAATFANLNSSEAFERMLHAITTLQPEILRNMGIVVDSQLAYKEFAEAQGISSQALTTTQKQTVILNQTLKQGALIAGAYEAAMETPGKALKSLERHIEEAKNALGESLLPAMKQGVDIATGFFISLQHLPDPLKAVAAGIVLTGGVLGQVIGPLQIASTLWLGLKSATAAAAAVELASIPMRAANVAAIGAETIALEAQNIAIGQNTVLWLANSSGMVIGSRAIGVAGAGIGSTAVAATGLGAAMAGLTPVLIAVGAAIAAVGGTLLAREFIKSNEEARLAKKSIHELTTEIIELQERSRQPATIQLAGDIATAVSNVPGIEGMTGALVKTGDAIRKLPDARPLDDIVAAIGRIPDPSALRELITGIKDIPDTARIASLSAGLEGIPSLEGLTAATERLGAMSDNIKQLPGAEKVIEMASGLRDAGSALSEIPESRSIRNLSDALKDIPSLDDLAGSTIQIIDLSNVIQNIPSADPINALSLGLIDLFDSMRDIPDIRNVEDLIIFIQEIPARTGLTDIARGISDVGIAVQSIPDTIGIRDIGDAIRGIPSSVTVREMSAGLRDIPVMDELSDLASDLLDVGDSIKDLPGAEGMISIGGGVRDLGSSLRDLTGIDKLATLSVNVKDIPGVSGLDNLAGGIGEVGGALAIMPSPGKLFDLGSAIRDLPGADKLLSVAGGMLTLGSALLGFTNVPVLVTMGIAAEGAAAGLQKILGIDIESKIKRNIEAMFAGTEAITKSLIKQEGSQKLVIGSTVNLGSTFEKLIKLQEEYNASAEKALPSTVERFQLAAQMLPDLAPQITATLEDISARGADAIAKSAMDQISETEQQVARTEIPKIIERLQQGIVEAEATGLGDVAARGRVLLEAFQGSLARAFDIRPQITLEGIVNPEIAAQSKQLADADQVQQTQARALGKELDQLGLASDRLGIQQMRLGLSVSVAEKSLRAAQESVKDITNQLNEAKERLQQFANAPLIGMKALDDQIFDLSQTAARFQLQMLEVGEGFTPGITAAKREALELKLAILEAGDATQTVLAGLNATANQLQSQMLGIQLGFAPEIGSARKEVLQLRLAMLEAGEATKTMFQFDLADMQRRELREGVPVARQIFEEIKRAQKGGAAEQKTPQQKQLEEAEKNLQILEIKQQLALIDLQIQSDIVGMQKRQVELSGDATAELRARLQIVEQELELQELRKQLALFDLQVESEAANTDLQRLNLVKQLTFDKPLRDLRDMVTITKEITFEEASEGIQQAQQDIDRLNGELASANQILADRQAVVDDLRRAQEDLTTASQLNRIAQAEYNLTLAESRIQFGLLKDEIETSVAVQRNVLNKSLADLKEQIKNNPLLFDIGTKPPSPIEVTVQNQIGGGQIGPQEWAGFAGNPAVGSNQNVLDPVVDAITSMFSSVKGMLGFKYGGVVPGPPGSPQLVMAHGGERISSNNSNWNVTINQHYPSQNVLDQLHRDARMMRLTRG